MLWYCFTWKVSVWALFAKLLSACRSVTMDSWSPDQLKKMQLGGNDALNSFFQKYGVEKATDIKEKYNSKAAEVGYRGNFKQCTGMWYWGRYWLFHPELHYGTALRTETTEGNSSVAGTCFLPCIYLFVSCLFLEAAVHMAAFHVEQLDQSSSLITMPQQGV